MADLRIVPVAERDRAAANEQAMAILQEALAEAEAGNLRFVALVTIDADGQKGFAASDSTLSEYELVGVVERIKHQILASFD